MPQEDILKSIKGEVLANRVILVAILLIVIIILIRVIS